MYQRETIRLHRCPHCNVAEPNLNKRSDWDTYDANRENRRMWAFYVCASCGGVLTSVARVIANQVQAIHKMWPQPQEVDEAVPERARTYLEQAVKSLQAPAGAVILAASSVDAMLKEKGLREGSLYKRIEAAAEQHLITAEMADWAHDVRLGANDQRHADDDAPLPSQEDAHQAIEFVQALAQFLFVLPSRVEKGRGK